MGKFKYKVVFLDEDGFEVETSLYFDSFQELLEELSCDGVEVVEIKRLDRGGY